MEDSPENTIIVAQNVNKDFAIKTEFPTYKDDIINIDISDEDIYIKSDVNDSMKVEKEYNKDSGSTLFYPSNNYSHKHIYDSSTFVKPTCLSQGYTLYGCRCGTHYATDYVTGDHDYQLFSYSKETCTENGVRIIMCSTCKNYEIEIIEPTWHTFGKDSETCTSCGYNRGHTFEDGKSKCSTCGYDKSDNCNCKCHKTGLITKLIWKFTLLFNKILRKNKVCACGVYHY
jgi:hypothetical protein